MVPRTDKHFRWPAVMGPACRPAIMPGLPRSQLEAANRQDGNVLLVTVGIARRQFALLTLPVCCAVRPFLVRLSRLCCHLSQWSSVEVHLQWQGCRYTARYTRIKGRHGSDAMCLWLLQLSGDLRSCWCCRQHWPP